MSWECKGCGAFRTRVEPTWPSCKPRCGGRLCHTVDTSLLTPERRHAIADLQAVQRELEFAYRPAAQYLFDRDASEDDRLEYWRAMITETHRRLFTAGRPEIAGILRDHDDVHVGGNGRHGFRPVAHHAIDEALDTLWERVVSRTASFTDVDHFARWAAEFLEDFFFIHPFTDGNGRTARLYVQRRARLAGWDMSWPSANGARRTAHRTYINALQYAHEHRDRCGNRVPGKDPFGPLARWIASLVELRDSSEVPPAGFDGP